MRTGLRAASFLALVLGGAEAVEACSDDEATPGSGVDASTSPDAASPTDAAIDVVQIVPDGGGFEGGAFGPYGLVYAGPLNGIDQRRAMITLGDDGRLLAYDAGANEGPYVTTAQVDGIYLDDLAVASRWTAGNVEGPFYGQSGTKPLVAAEGQHLGAARVPGEMPASGTATYSLAAATKPTIRGGVVGEGAVTAGTLRAEFAGNVGTRIGYSFTVTMPDGTFEVIANGGATNVGDAGGTFSAVDGGFRFTNHGLAVSTSATTCAPEAGACPASGSTRVVFGGPNAERIVVAYVFGNGSAASTRSGVLVFKKQ